MFLREILFKNFQEIIEEVALICGGSVSNQIISFLFDENSLDEQFRQAKKISKKKTAIQDELKLS